jgi:glycosidase
VTRFTDDSPRYRDLGAKLLALMQTTLGGTLYLYQGEEVGMKNFPLSWDPSEYKDIETVNYWKKMQDLSGGDESKMVEAKRIIQRKARDHARTPVQWSDGPNAGFCPENVTPWMRVNDDYKEVNVAAQVPRHQNTLKDASKEQGGGLKSSISKAAQKIADNFAPVGSSLGPVVPTHSMPIPSSEGEPLSVWQFWQRGLANRKAHKDVFVYGTFEALDVSNEDVFAYRRVGEKEAFVVLLNFTGETVSLDLPEKPAKTSKWVISNYAEGPTDRALQGKIMLKPWEGLLGTAVV